MRCNVIRHTQNHLLFGVKPIPSLIMSYRSLPEKQKEIYAKTIPRFVNKEDLAAALHQANFEAKLPATNPNSMASPWHVYQGKTLGRKVTAKAAADDENTAVE